MTKIILSIALLLSSKAYAACPAIQGDYEMCKMNVESDNATPKALTILFSKDEGQAPQFTIHSRYGRGSVTTDEYKIGHNDSWISSLPEDEVLYELTQYSYCKNDTLFATCFVTFKDIGGVPLTGSTLARIKKKYEARGVGCHKGHTYKLDDHKNLVIGSLEYPTEVITCSRQQ